MQHPPTDSRRHIRALVLTPTRELAAQIDESFRTYGRHTGLRYTVIFGGVGQGPQVNSLKAGVDVVIATPGRLLDLMNQGFVDLRHLEQFVLDEADNMLDMGFIHDIRKVIAKLPARRQTLMFSATMPREIRQLADTILNQPVSVQVAPVATPAEKVEQAVYFVDKPDKPAMLAHYLKSEGIERVLVFTRTKHGADKVVRHLLRAGVRAEAIHGNKSQGQRVRAMKNFKSTTPPVLVATDIAARGLDIDEVSHVVNYDLPNVPETYVHRIGRTGRAGASGTAVSFCDREEKPYLKDIEKLTRKTLRVIEHDVTKLPRPQVLPPVHHHNQSRPTPPHVQHRDAKPVMPQHSVQPRRPQPKGQPAAGRQHSPAARPQRAKGFHQNNKGRGKRQRPRFW